MHKNLLADMLELQPRLCLRLRAHGERDVFIGNSKQAGNQPVKLAEQPLLRDVQVGRHGYQGLSHAVFHVVLQAARAVQLITNRLQT